MALSSLLIATPWRPCPICSIAKRMGLPIDQGRCRVARSGTLVACANPAAYDSTEPDLKAAVDAQWDEAEGAGRSDRLVAGVRVRLFLWRKRSTFAGGPASEVHTILDREGEISRTEHRRRQTESAEKIWTKTASPQPVHGEFDADVHQSSDHPRLRAYLEHRRIPIDRLPGGVVPASLRYLHRCPVQGGRRDDACGPAMVGRVDVIAFGDAPTPGDKPGFTRRGVHRTFLDPAWRPGAFAQAGKRADVEGDGFGKAKQMRGAIKGGAIFLARSYPERVMVVAEGVETVLSCMAATGWGGAALLSADGVGAWQIPEGLFDAGTGVVDTLVICADRNRPGSLKDSARSDSRTAFAAELVAMGMERALADHVAGLGTGERAGWTLWQRMRVERPHVACVVCVMPGVDPEDPGRAWDANDELASPHGGGIDVVARVLREAAGTVKSDRDQGPRGSDAGGTAGDESMPSDQDAGSSDGLAGLPPSGPPGAPSASPANPPGDPPWDGRQAWELPDPEDRPLIGESPVERGRRWLLTQFGRGGGVGSQQLGFRAWGDRFWWFTGTCYEPVDATLLDSNALTWLGSFSRIRVVGQAEKVVGMVPKRGDVESMISAVHRDCVFDSEASPCWLPPQPGAAGGPVFDTAFRAAPKALEVCPARGRASDWAVFPNGALNMARLADESLPLDRRIELVPHDARLFTSTCLGFPLDVDGLRDVLRATPKGDAWLTDDHPVFIDKCPKFWSWLATACCEDVAWQRQIACMMGDTIALNRANEKIYAMVGLPGGGKGYLQDILTELIGPRNIGALTSRSFSDKTFGLSHLVGKCVVLLNESDLSGQRGSDAASDLKALRSGDLMPVRNLYGSTQSLRMRLKIWLFANSEPDLQDNSGALADSFVFLPVNRGFRNTAAEDPSIKASAGREASGIMLFALLGAVLLARSPRRQIPLCSDSQRMHERYLMRSAPVQHFVAECMMPTTAELCDATLEALYWTYRWHCRRVMGTFPSRMVSFETDLHWAIKRAHGVFDLSASGSTGKHQRKVQGWTVRPAIAERVREYVVGEGYCSESRLPECLRSPMNAMGSIPFMS